MRKVQQGRKEAMGLLFERYHRRLFGFFYHMTGRGDLSEDLVQTVFYRMLKYPHSFKGEGKFTTWMFHLARNVWADHYKQEKKMPVSERHTGMTLTGKRHTGEILDKDAWSYEQENDSEDHLSMLRKALNYLSPERKEVLLLSRYQGLRYREIADLMQCSEANVKVKVFRAIQDLKKIFEQLEKQ